MQKWNQHSDSVTRMNQNDSSLAVHDNRNINTSSEEFQEGFDWCMSARDDIVAEMTCGYHPIIKTVDWAHSRREGGVKTLLALANLETVNTVQNRVK